MPETKATTSDEKLPYAVLPLHAALPKIGGKLPGMLDPVCLSRQPLRSSN